MVLALPVLAQIPNEDDAAVKCEALDGGDNGSDFNAKRSSRCSADSDTAAAVCFASRHELPQLSILSPDGLESLGAMLQSARRRSALLPGSSRRFAGAAT